MDLLKVFDLLVFIVKKIFAKTGRNRKEACEYDGFEYSRLLSKHIIIFLITVVFSTMYPLILLFGLLYFLTIMLSTRHNLLYCRQPPFDGAGYLFPSILHYICASLIIYHISMIAVLGTYEFPQGAVLLAPLIITLVFLFYMRLKNFLHSPFSNLKFSLFKTEKQIARIATHGAFDDLYSLESASEGGMLKLKEKKESVVELIQVQVNKDTEKKVEALISKERDTVELEKGKEEWKDEKKEKETKVLNGKNLGAEGEMVFVEIGEEKENEKSDEKLIERKMISNVKEETIKTRAALEFWIPKENQNFPSSNEKNFHYLQPSLRPPNAIFKLFEFEEKENERLIEDKGKSNN